MVVMMNTQVMDGVLRQGKRMLVLSPSQVAAEKFFCVYTLRLSRFSLVIAAVGTCSANQIYEECGSPCIKTCSNPEYSCSSHCTYGCFCPEGNISVFIIF